MTKEELEEFENVVVTGFIKDLGVHVVEMEEGRCVVEMEITEKHMNPIGTVHGGIVFSLADTVGGYAVHSAGEYACTTCTSSIDFYTPTMGAKKLIGTAEVLKHGSRMSTVEVTISTDKGVAVASLIGRYYHLKESMKAK